MSEATRRTLYAIVWWDEEQGTQVAPLAQGQLIGPFKTATQARNAAKTLVSESHTAGRTQVRAQVLWLTCWLPVDSDVPVTLSFDRLVDNVRLTQLTRENRALKARVKELEGE